jgi:orotate phosphoribosyltransferase
MNRRRPRDRGQATSTRAVMSELYERGLFRTWFRDRPEGWTLVSGQWSPIYLQLRELCSYPDLLRDIASLLGRLVEKESGIDRIAGVAYAGLPIALATSLATGIPCLMTRKIDTGSEADAQLKAYGQHALVEGAMRPGDRVALVDDLVTGFDSKLVATSQILEEARRRGIDGVSCSDVFVVIDREQGASERASTLGYQLRALMTLREGLELLRPRLATEEHEVISAYLSDPAEFQDPERQATLRAMHKTEE